MAFFKRIDDSAFGKAARNERRKIRANFMNGLAVSALAIGYLAPAAGAYARAGELTYAQGVFMAILVVVSMLIAHEFHSIALKEAGRIED